MQEFNIRVFRAIDDRHSCKEFVKGHTKVLVDYGVTMITSSKPTWATNPNVYCLVAESVETQEMVGGVRVHVSNGTTPLPLEEAVGKLDNTIYSIVRKYLKKGVGEICGLWNSKNVAGLGLSFVLTRSGIAIVEQLRFQFLMTICADFTLKMCINLGFLIDESLGNGGKFPYPTDDYITRVLGIMNAQSLATTITYDKKRIITLREQPIQSRIENEKNEKFVIHYNLRIHNNPLIFSTKARHNQQEIEL